MAKKESGTAALRSVFLCSACGNESPKWFGRCPHCHGWNTAVEETARAAVATKHRSYGAGAASAPTRLREIEAAGDRSEERRVGKV